jgi:hypothetical protein
MFSPGKQAQRREKSRSGKRQAEPVGIVLRFRTC